MNDEETKALQAIGQTLGEVAVRHVEAEERNAVAFENVAHALGRIANAMDRSNTQTLKHRASQDKMCEGIVASIGDALANLGGSRPAQQASVSHLRPVPEAKPDPAEGSDE